MMMHFSLLIDSMQFSKGILTIDEQIYRHKYTYDCNFE